MLCPLLRIPQRAPKRLPNIPTPTQAAGKCIGGFGRLATFIGQKRVEAPTLVLDAGDQCTGTLWDVAYRNHTATAAAQNKIGFNAMVRWRYQL